MPPWRASLAWVALVPLLAAILSTENVTRPHFLRRSMGAAYLCGVLWYLLNCYWIYATMHQYGGIGSIASGLILLGYSLVLGGYFAVFGLLVALFRRAFGNNFAPLAAAPVLWVALELAAARITCVPWDQLGYSQVDNFLLTRLAPWTGVYGISLVLMVGNALLAGACLVRGLHWKLRLAVAGVLLAVGLQLGSFVTPPPAPTTASAVLLQQNLDVSTRNDWVGAEWDRHTQTFLALSSTFCGPYFVGMPEPAPVQRNTECAGAQTPSIVAWPEAPTPFRDKDPRFHLLMAELTSRTGATAVVGNIAVERDGPAIDIFNSAQFVAPDGHFLGRYDKIHLVPFGEYVPYKGLISFAGTLTEGVSEFSRGSERKVFPVDGHLTGAFICYEAVFANEIRQFARKGAEVFVNISDDGWYGDTSAPWQHLNMARMRAIENRRWLLRDTNSGVTAAIDPQGRVVQSAPRHVLTSLAVRYGYRDDVTFYTRHGDVFAWVCGIIAIAGTVAALLLARRGSRTATR